MQKNFNDPVGEINNNFGDQPSVVHRGNKGADKEQTRCISERYQMPLATLGLSSKGT